jgi:hypothetical protein
VDVDKNDVSHLYVTMHCIQGYCSWVLWMVIGSDDRVPREGLAPTPKRSSVLASC